MNKNYIYILIMAGVSFLIRALPMTLFRKQIKSRFIRSFLYYVPYVTLSVMTFPAIVNATGNPVSGAIALVIGILAAWFGADLFKTAIICCGAVFLLEWFI